MALANEPSHRHFNQFNNAQVYVVGQAGVGKSSLINCLLMERAQNVVGKSKMKEIISQKHQHLRTRYVDPPPVKLLLSKDGRSFDITMSEINLTDSMNATHLDLSRKGNKQRNLIIYCTRMDETRYLNDDILVMTNFFGRDIWTNAIIALTFANRVAVDNPYGMRSVDAKKFFKEEYQSWVETLSSCLEEQAGIDTTIIQKIPILPTGTMQRLSLPTIKDWVFGFEEELWHVLFRENERLKRIKIDDGEFSWTLAGATRAVVQAIVQTIIRTIFGSNYFDTNKDKLDEVADDKLQHTYLLSFEE